MPCRAELSVRTAAPSARQPLERRHARRQVVEALLVDREDHHLRRAEDARVVEGAHLDQHGSCQARAASQDVGAAVGAVLAGGRRLEVVALEHLRLPLRVGEARRRHAEHDVRMPARDVLALAAVALALEDRLALGPVAERAAVAASFGDHVVLSFEVGARP
jgi:hypothetical protein